MIVLCYTIIVVLMIKNQILVIEVGILRTYISKVGKCVFLQYIRTGKNENRILPEQL